MSIAGIRLLLVTTQLMEAVPYRLGGLMREWVNNCDI